MDAVFIVNLGVTESKYYLSKSARSGKIKLGLKIVSVSKLQTIERIEKWIFPQ